MTAAWSPAGDQVRRSPRGGYRAKYSTATGKLTTTGAGNLNVYNVHGCAGLIATATPVRSSARM
jgi:hypothetical protein